MIMVYSSWNCVVTENLCILLKIPLEIMNQSFLFCFYQDKEFIRLLFLLSLRIY